MKNVSDGGTLKEKFSALENSGFIVSFKPYQKQIHLVLITNAPIKQTMYSEEMIAYNVVLSDLF